MSDILNLSQRLCKSLAAQYVINFPGAIIITVEGPDFQHLEQWYKNEVEPRWPDVKLEMLENDVIAYLNE